MTATTMDQFLRACGATGPWRLGIQGPDAPGVEERMLRQPFAVVGRDADVDLRLDHPEVSRRHSYLQLLGGHLFCVDLQSRTGTRWQQGLKPMDWVRPDQAVGIGPYWIWPRDEFAPDPDPEASALAVVVVDESESDPASVAARLEISGPGAAPSSWQIRRPIVLLGRSRPCWLRLPSADVSRVHCSLVRTEAGFWVVDLLSRGGLAVNGQPVRWARLDADDELAIGPYQVRLRLDAEQPRPSWSLARLADVPGGRGPLLLQPERGGPLAARLEPTDPALAPLLREIGQMQQQMTEQFQQTLLMMFQMFSGMHQDQMALMRQELAEIRRLAEEQQALRAELARLPQPSQPQLAPGNGAPRTVPVPGTAPPPRTTPAPPPGPSRPPEATTAAPAGTDPEGDLHAFLNERLAWIQEEQESRWQKLMRSIMGGRNQAEAKP